MSNVFILFLINALQSTRIVFIATHFIVRKVREYLYAIVQRTLQNMLLFAAKTYFVVSRTSSIEFLMNKSFIVTKCL